MSKTAFMTAILFTALSLAVPSAHAADSAAGKKVFAKCKSCHEVDKEKNKVGPSLKGLLGRAAGTVEGFKYSDAMKSSGITWNEDTLTTYLADPKAMVPGTKMVFTGLKKPEDIENVIEYLKEAAQ